MRKTYQLRPEGKNPDRVLDAVKHDIRKYLKRERRRALPEGVDYWDFDCRFGLAQDSAQVVHLSALSGLIDEVAKAEGPECYVEILARHGHRTARPTDAAASADA